MGLAIADTAAEYGAEVQLVLGPVNRLPKHDSIRVINVVSAESMASECLTRFPDCDIAILAAAVADFTPGSVETKKMKRTGDELILSLKPTRDIAEALGKMKKKSQILVGFALETHDELANARTKLTRKNLDLIVLNSMQDEGAGFGHETNKITIIDRNNNIDKFELKTKEEASKDILDRVVSLLESQQ
jgi:phosphopantothenoylcysteine decarboxylase/phosphopantothenate--cysteine ligase